MYVAMQSRTDVFIVSKSQRELNQLDPYPLRVLREVGEACHTVS